MINGRRHTITLNLTDEFFRKIKLESNRDGMRAGAWVRLAIIEKLGRENELRFGHLKGRVPTIGDLVENPFILSGRKTTNNP